MPMCCTDTRYTDDAHYIGGALGLTNLQWGASFKGVMVMPPDPAIVGEHWREMWMERLNATPNILHNWISHQRNDSLLAARFGVRQLCGHQVPCLHRGRLGGYLREHGAAHALEREVAAQSLDWTLGTQPAAVGKPGAQLGLGV